MDGSAPRNHLAVILGITLIAAGAVLVAAQLVGVTVFTLGWPLLVIVPGLVMMAAAFSMPGGRHVSFVAVPGAVVLVTGIVLELQAISGDWQSWSYAWPVIVPGSVGIGLLVAGARERMPGVRTVGVALLVAGAALFVAAEWLFVRVAGVGGPGLGNRFGLALPIMVVALGLWVISRGLRRDR